MSETNVRKCQRCEDPKCDPEQVPGSKTPCITCGQPYGNHCFTRHCKTQSNYTPERWKMVEENKALGTEVGPNSHADVMAACEKVLAKDRN